MLLGNVYRNGEERYSIRCQDSGAFAHGLPIVWNVFQDVIADDHVERMVWSVNVSDVENGVGISPWLDVGAHIGRRFSQAIVERPFRREVQHSHSLKVEAVLDQQQGEETVSRSGLAVRAAVLSLLASSGADEAPLESAAWAFSEGSFLEMLGWISDRAA